MVIMRKWWDDDGDDDDDEDDDEKAMWWCGDVSIYHYLSYQEIEPILETNTFLGQKYLCTKHNTTEKDTQ